MLRLWAESTDDFWNPARERGYLRTHQEAGIEPAYDQRPMQVPESLDRSKVESAEFLTWITGVLTPYMLSEMPPDAILAPSDGFCEIVGMALDTLCSGSACARPLVVGFDGLWDIIETDANRQYRPAATIDKQPYLIGRSMGEVLVSRIAGSLLPEEAVWKICPVALRVYEETSA